MTIVIDVNAKVSIGHADILWRGAAALAMTYILEEAGYRVELWIVHRASDAYTKGGRHVNAVCLKRAQDPLDIATFSAAVSGWFYRTLMFRVKSRADRNLRRGAGHPECPGCGELEHIIPAREFILISGTYSRSGAVYLAREALRKIATPPAPSPVEPDVEPVAAPAASKPAEPIRQPTKKEIAEWNRRWKAYQRANVEG